MEDADDVSNGNEFGKALSINQKELETKLPCQINKLQGGN